MVDADEFEEFPEQEVAYNIRLLKEGGYIEGNILESRAGDSLISKALARRLTNSGHDLLDVFKSEPVWERVKEQFRNKSIEMTLDMVLQVGKATMKQMLFSSSL